MPHPPRLIRSKTRVPGLGADVIDRPRVVDALCAAAEGRTALLVAGPAGSGKTTAVVQFLGCRGGPRGWLTAGEADASPGRLATYLAEAAADVAPAAADRARNFLADGLAPADGAAMLGEDLPSGAILVLDDLHHLEAEPGARRVLRAFLDAVPAGALVVLIARRLTRLDLGRDLLAGRVGVVGEGELAFRADEVADLLAARGLGGQPDEIAVSSGGWAAGIVFDALRAGGRGVPAGPGEDPFFGYLGSEVLGAMPPDVRDMVVRSALLEVVGPHGLDVLLGAGAGRAAYERIARERPPATPVPEGLRYHPRFREYLLDVLARESPEELRLLRVRYARALLEEGHREEAADHLLAAGARTEAEEAVTAAAPELMRRGDWAKVLAWCDALGEDAPARRADLRGAQIRSLLMSRRQGDVETLVHAMRTGGEMARVASVAPDVAAWAAWALHVSGEWRTVLELAPPADASRRARAIRYIIETGVGEEPPPGFAGDELDRPWPLHVALQSALYYRGRFAEVERLAWAAAERGPVTATLAEIYRVAVMRARGDLADARAALDAAAPRVRESRFIEFWQQVEAELVFAEGDHERGLALIREARATARRHGYRLADRGVLAAVEGRMLVTMGRPAGAVEPLEAARSWCAGRGLLCFREWADVWLAAGLLALGRGGDRPRALAASAVAGMERAERRLELPAAHVALAEAAWRAGDEAAHDAAADAAYAASERMGTLGPLLSALEAMPDVLARRIDASPRDDDAWRALARRRTTVGGPPPAGGARLQVRTFGRAEVRAGDETLALAPAKAVEVAAAIARAGSSGVERAALVDDLLEGSADGANYLRQLVHRLRRALPPDVELRSARGRLAWWPPGAVACEDEVLEGLMARAGRETGEARLLTMEEALAMADRGPYLPEVEGEAARRRRAELAALVAEARREHGRALLAAGRAARAAEAARAAVAADPYREDGWRLLMRAEASAHGAASALPAFLECARTLAEVGLEPSSETEGLLRSLRG